MRNTFRFASRKYWDQIAHDLRPVYTAASEAEALARFEEFEEKWGKPYPAISRLWRDAWAEFIPFLDYGGCREIGVSRAAAGSGRGELVVAKSYRPVLRDQPMFLPVDMRDWLPPDHLVWFVLDTVDALDTCAVGADPAPGWRGRRRV